MGGMVAKSFPPPGLYIVKKWAPPFQKLLMWMILQRESYLKEGAFSESVLLTPLHCSRLSAHKISYIVRVNFFEPGSGTATDLVQVICPMPIAGLGVKYQWLFLAATAWWQTPDICESCILKS